MNKLDRFYTIEVLKKVSNEILKSLDAYNFICNEISNASNSMSSTKMITKYLKDNKPTKELHSKFYNHKYFIRDIRDIDKNKCVIDDNPPWWKWSALFESKDIERIVNMQRVKFIDLLIRQLKKEDE